MPAYCFLATHRASTDEVWDELQSLGATLLYSEEYEERKEVVANIDESFHFEVLRSVKLCFPTQLPEIDWTAQWSTHGLDFKDGFVHLNLNSFIDACNLPTLKLEPGPGFGDLSHPTTRLVIKLMTNRMQHNAVLDIGTGSGVLALCAKLLGAEKVWGYDIDPEAVKHAQKNLFHNHLEQGIDLTFLPPLKELLQQKKLVILMNMILSEQKEAWETVKPIHHIPGEAIVSGILLEEKESYLKQAAKWKWELIEELQEEGWLAFCFKRHSQ